MREDNIGIPRKPAAKLLEIGIFKDRILQARKTSQIGFILVTVNEIDQGRAISSLIKVIRQVDSFTVIKPGQIIVLITKLLEKASLDIVVGKFNDVLPDNEYKFISITSLFLPYTLMEYDQITHYLQNRFGLTVNAALLSEKNCLECAALKESNDQLISENHKLKLELESYNSAIIKVEKNHQLRRYEDDVNNVKRRRNEAGYNGQK